MLLPICRWYNVLRFWWYSRHKIYVYSEHIVSIYVVSPLRLLFWVASWLNQVWQTKMARGILWLSRWPFEEMVQHTLHLHYDALAQPHLEYCVRTWSSYLVWDVEFTVSTMREDYENWICSQCPTEISAISYFWHIRWATKCKVAGNQIFSTYAAKFLQKSTKWPCRRYAIFIRVAPF